MPALLPKPQMRNLLARYAKISGSIGATLTVTVTVAYWYFVAENRTKVYAEYYKHYDPDKEFEIMRKTGVFRSVPPD